MCFIYIIQISCSNDLTAYLTNFDILTNCPTAPSSGI